MMISTINNSLKAINNSVSNISKAVDVINSPTSTNDNIVQSMVDIIVNQTIYNANLVVIKTSDEVQQRTIDIFI